MTDNMTASRAATARAIEILGGQNAATRILGVSRQVVQHWIKTRVPAEQCPGIERATRERGQAVLCEAMRPDVPWQILREQVA